MNIISSKKKSHWLCVRSTYYLLGHTLFHFFRKYNSFASYLLLTTRFIFIFQNRCIVSFYFIESWIFDLLIFVLLVIVITIYLIVWCVFEWEWFTYVQVFYLFFCLRNSITEWIERRNKVYIRIPICLLVFGQMTS